MGKRESNPPIQKFLDELGGRWSDIFNNANWNVVDEFTLQHYGIYTAGAEGQCGAVILNKNGTIIAKGTFRTDYYHAEMDALRQVQNQDDIGRIIISSPPCPCCCVLLTEMGLMDKVYAPDKKSRCCPSGNVPREFFLDNFGKNLRYLYRGKDISDSYIEKHQNDIISNFLGKSWVSKDK
ncbi:MAG: hypothetical protein IJJ71_01790 [Treponema sp.]|uniref:hypothetical protein n=1 Tax=Treponema sp. TaxID=166 RepID=UPI0025D49DEB|nr:hypothetical protein [Treponema sp.]MBR0494892.1 hypothetical protein [Treponema sp.]